MRRKLFCVSAAMVFGIWVAGIDKAAAVGLISAAFLYAMILYMKPEYDVSKIKALALACAVAMLIGAMRLMTQEWSYCRECAGLDPSKNSVVRAEVLKVCIRKDKPTKITVRNINTGRKLMLTYYGSGKEINGSRREHSDETYKVRMLVGSIIEFNGKLSEPDSARNPRCFDYRQYLRSQGIGIVSSTQSIKVIKETGSAYGLFRRRVIAFRESFINRFCNRGPTIRQVKTSTNKAISKDAKSKTDETEALLRGVLFGDTDSMDEDMKDDFRRNGTAHVLAVSGLHIGLLYSLFRALRRKVPVPLITPVFLIILGIYGTMTLWAVSVTRAIMLILMMELGDRLDRPFDLLTSLGFVSMLVLLHEPYALYGTSFIMSYLAALSIGMICPIVKAHLPELVPDSIKTSVAVQLGIAPYVAYTFNIISFGSILINIPVIMLLTVIVTASAALVPVYVFSEHVMSLLSLIYISFIDRIVVPIDFVISISSRLMILINERFSAIDILSPDIVSPPLWIVFMFYAILFILCSESFRVARLRKNFALITPLIGLMIITVMISCVASISEFDKADIIMVDVGQGDCMHLRIRNKVGFVRYNVLIDGGGNADYDIGKKTLKPYLLKNGARRIDLAVVTHLHTDHYDGIRSLAQQGMVEKLCIYEGYRTQEKKIMEECGLDRDDLIYVTAGDEIRLGEAIFKFLAPPARNVREYEQLAADEEDENKKSLLIKVVTHGISVMMTGDIGEEGEREVMKSQTKVPLKSDILKVGHHGSKTSSCNEFLDEVDPTYAVIQVGKNNMYGHPSPEVLERLKDYRVRVYRNDLQGAVGIIQAGGKIKKIITIQ